MGNNDFHNLQQLFNNSGGNSQHHTTVNTTKTNACNKPRPSNGNLNNSTNVMATNNTGKQQSFSYPFLPSSNQTATTNPMSSLNLPSSMASNNNASMLNQTPTQQMPQHSGFTLERATAANNTLESRNNNNNNQMMNQSISGQNPSQQQQQQQQLNSMLSHSRHLPFPYNLNNFHRNY